MKGGAKSTSIVNYIYILLAINYTIIVNFITHIDSTGYGMLALSVLVIILNSKSLNQIQYKKPVVFWTIWCIYTVLNYFVHPHPFPLNFFIILKKVFVPLISMIVAIKEFERNPNTLLWVCLIAYLLYTGGGYYYDTGILYRDVDEDANVLGNAYAITVSFTLFYLALLNRTGKLSMLWFVVMTVIIVIALAMSGTRKAFGAGLLFIVFWAFSMFNIHKIRTWLFVGLFACLGWTGYASLMENTFMGARMEVLEKQQEEYLPARAPKFLRFFGDRASHYYYGVKQFIEHPLFGEGLQQSRVNHGKVYFHSEPIAQLTDNGIVGFSLFFAFYYWVTTRLWRKRKENSSIGRCMIGGLIGIFFLMLTAWTWEFPSYFICLGILIGYCKTGEAYLIGDTPRIVKTMS